MPQLFTSDLVRLLREVGEQDELLAVDLSGDIDDVPFTDLGFDSLAIYNVLTRVEQSFGVELNYDMINEVTTPRTLLLAINQALRIHSES